MTKLDQLCGENWQFINVRRRYSGGTLPLSVIAAIAQAAPACPGASCYGANGQ